MLNAPASTAAVATEPVTVAPSLSKTVSALAVSAVIHHRREAESEWGGPECPPRGMLLAGRARIVASHAKALA